jgi:hemolysin III
VKEKVNKIKENKVKKSKVVNDPVSALTHFIGLLLVVIGVIPLLIKAGRNPDPIYIASFLIYAISLILLYAASSTYHSFGKTKKVRTILKKIDHIMIFVLIAGTYTPICLLVLERPIGLILLIVIWGIALLGGIFKLFWVYCPKWVSSILYIGMGWACIFAFSHLFRALLTGGFVWLLIGGIIYTMGGVLYALKLKVFNNRFKSFGSHEIFHLFVMGGSACHFIVMYFFVLP